MVSGQGRAVKGRYLKALLAPHRLTDSETLARAFNGRRVPDKTRRLLEGRAVEASRRRRRFFSFGFGCWKRFRCYNANKRCPAESGSIVSF